MDQPLHAEAAAGIGDRPGTIDMHRLIALTAALPADAGGIDHGVAAGDHPGDRRRHAQVGAHQHDLADVACGLDRLGQFDAPRRDLHQKAALRQRPHDGPADEAATAQNSDRLDAHDAAL